MSEHPNAALYRRVFDATRDGNVEQVKSALSPEVVWHEAGAPEPLRGREAVLDRFRGMFGAADDLSEVEMHDVMATDDHTVALVQATIRAGGQEVSYPVVEVLHIDDGMVTERWAMMDAVPDDVARFFAGLGT